MQNRENSPPRKGELRLRVCLGLERGKSRGLRRERPRAGGRGTERRSPATAQWSIVPLALASVWVERGEGHRSHFSWAWLPVTWKLISGVNSAVLGLKALAGV